VAVSYSTAISSAILGSMTGWVLGTVVVNTCPCVPMTGWDLGTVVTNTCPCVPTVVDHG